MPALIGAAAALRLFDWGFVIVSTVVGGIVTAAGIGALASLGPPPERVLALALAVAGIAYQVQGSRGGVPAAPAQPTRTAVFGYRS